jgi:hypothetical protein
LSQSGASCAETLARLLGQHPQLLLPIRDASGRQFLRKLYDALVDKLTDQFGGVTAYARVPAAGLWEEESGRKVRDDVVVDEVMGAKSAGATIPAGRTCRARAFDSPAVGQVGWTRLVWTSARPVAV